MTITVSTVSNSQTFGAWLSTTNRLANIVSQNTVTTDYSTGGSLTTGNGFVNGYFGGTYLYASDGLIGGNVSSNGVLSIFANVAFKYSTSNLMTITANALSSSINFEINVFSKSIIPSTNTSWDIGTSSNSYANVYALRIIAPTIIANGGTGTAGQVLTSNGSTTYWSTVTGASGTINATTIALTGNLTLSTSSAFIANGSSGSAGQVLTTNGTSTYWSTVTGGSGIPGGANTQIQFNNSNTFGGSANLTFNATTSTLTVANTIIVGSSRVNTSTINTVSLGVSGNSTLSGPIDVSGSYRANIVAVAALDIDCSTGNYFTKTISTSSTFTFSNAPSSRAYGFTLELTHTSGTVTWPTSVKWPSDVAPSLTTSKTHLFMFVTDDGGTRWRGAALVDYVN